MVANIMHMHMSNIQTAKNVFNLFENPGLSHPMLNVCDNLSSRNRDVAQNMFYRVLTLKGQGHL